MATARNREKKSSSQGEGAVTGLVFHSPPSCL